jgi:hypothetical protein
MYLPEMGYSAPQAEKPVDAVIAAGRTGRQPGTATEMKGP